MEHLKQMKVKNVTSHLQEDEEVNMYGKIKRNGILIHKCMQRFIQIHPPIN